MHYYVLLIVLSELRVKTYVLVVENRIFSDISETPQSFILGKKNQTKG